ncbi:LytR/AlgR family response regulator transcription factor [Pedobacter paludis]|uniref:DNA-binding response regulator n=1 Tax=Pedobacter paludis TaxID=2203212 RepID=A0A317EY73_9SPHI|nr:response regulator transcription factor [Pedobacter paludis]PWS31801.1 DNA-binding response regulator [Pedobacter paludis]
MITCVIVDDEEHAIEVIQHYIQSISYINLVASFTNPVEAMNFLNGQKVDLIFLDIHMPEISGIEFIQSFIDKKQLFILTTAYREFATTAFDLEVADYLVKPIPLHRFLQAINKVQNRLEKPAEATTTPLEMDYFMVKTEAKGKMLKINIMDIDFIEGMKNYVAFHHNGIRTLALLTMKDVEERLPEKHFVRVQKSFIIAINKITAINGNQVTLKGISSEIFIGDTYRKQFLEQIKRKLII